MVDQPARRKMSRHGRRCAEMNDSVVRMVRYRKSWDEKVSSLKFVAGAMVETRRSCPAVKSAILFCRSRILRKKSLDVSLAGLIVRAGASAGPV